MKKAILLISVLTLVAFVSGAMAQPKPAEKPAATEKAPAKAPAPKMEKFAGEVMSVDAMGKTFVVAKGKTQKIFAAADDTKITKGKETLKLEDLKAGMNVAVQYKKEGDKMVATTVKASAPKAAAKKAPQKPAEAPKK